MTEKNPQNNGKTKLQTICAPHVIKGPRLFRTLDVRVSIIHIHCSTMFDDKTCLPNMNNFKVQ